MIPKLSIIKSIAWGVVFTALPGFYSATAAQVVEHSELYSLASCGTPSAQAQSSSIGPAESSTNPDTSSPKAGAAKSNGTLSAQELASQSNDPTAPLTTVQFRDVYIPDAKVKNGLLNTFEIQPVIPIGPFEWLPLTQLMKITMPLVSTTPEPGSKTGLGDLEVFDLFTVKQSWGRWGVGPILVFPTATNEELGAGKYQAGPSAGAIYSGIKNFIVGAVLQNPISFAGDSNRLSVNQLIVTPTLYYNFEDGWFVGLSDFNWTFDWKDNGAALIPVGLQVGKVFHIGTQPFNLSVEAGRAVARPSDMPDPGWIFGFEITPIFDFRFGSSGK